MGGGARAGGGGGGLDECSPSFLSLVLFALKKPVGRDTCWL